ncbi:hypothetical protein H0H92_006531 [Tricholoma furcatifolium]|nr:hypothetical protein H0H92_006531 [Tricholoma furcatifolium]
MAARQPAVACLNFTRKVWQSFIETKGHDAQCFPNLSIKDAYPGTVIAALKIEQSHLNRVGTVHGGLILSLTDTLGSLAVATKGHFMTGVSTDIGTTFVRPAGRVGDVLHAKATLTGLGKSLAYTRVDFTSPDGELVAYGYHTKYVGKSSSHPVSVLIEFQHMKGAERVGQKNIKLTKDGVSEVVEDKTVTTMDELSALPPEELRRRTTRQRTPYAPSVSPVSTRAGSPFRQGIEILAPTPRRHLLDTSASQHWLRTPPHSPISSRAASPASTTASRLRHPSLSGALQHLQEHERDLQLSPVARLQKPKPSVSVSASTSTSTSTHTHVADSTSMGRRWIRWMHRRNLRAWVVPVAVGTAVLVKLALGVGSYSGHGTPPMYGDYEAQRHWMELTLHLPVRQWYTYDLQYWGLDYPPLTAYVSWLCGVVGAWIQPAWFALDKSRGIETPGSKVFMRATVVAFDLMIYIPALVMFAGTWQGTRSKRTQPALLLIDNGHFQYNSVMLGLTLFALNFFATGQDLLGAVCFVLSLGFKQMALYYAPAIGTYLLAKCVYLGPSKGTTLFIRLASTTLLTFLLLFLPFLPPFAPLTAILDPITRIFPFARGLFEDKVANFWCASNVVFKWKNWASATSLVRLSAALTAFGFLPSVFMMLQAGFKFMKRDQTQQKGDSAAVETTYAPFLPLLPYALLNSSMSFFLFSFQVHEKTILLPLLPITLLLSGAHVDSTVYSWGVLVNNVAVFSMWPLLKRDGLVIQYVATLLFWNRLVGHNPFRIPQKSFIQILSAAVYAAAVGLHLLEMVIAPPSRYPDVYPVLNVLVSTPVFVLAWLWSIKSGFEVGWAIGGLGSTKADGRRRLSFSGGKMAPEGMTGSYRQLGGRAGSLGKRRGAMQESG